MAIDERRILKRKLKDEDLTEYLQQQGNKKKNTKQLDEFYKKDKVIEQLKDCLRDQIPDDRPDEILNILKNYLDEKKKQKEINSQIQSAKVKRLNTRQLDLIKDEFEKLKGSKRSVKIMELMLGGLKFFQRCTPEETQLILEEAKFERRPARSQIFDQGDVGDNMYVILKGRVAVQIRSQQISNLPRVVALLGDGVHFGELSLLDDSGNGEKKFATRRAACITAEQTDLLVIDPELSQKLYRRDKKKKPQTKTET